MNLDGAVIDNSVIGGTTAAAGTFTTLTASGDLTVDTNTLKVDSTNNRVGINNASPSAELDITGTGEDISVRINAPTGYDAELKFANNGTTAFTLGHDDATDNFVIGTANVDTNPRFVIDSSGNVGINTASPTVESGRKGLHIHDGTGPELHMTDTASGTTASDGAVLVFDNPNFYVSNKEAGPIQFWTNGSEKARLDSSGNLGIGTTSPARQIHLVNSGNALMKLESTSASGYGGIDFANASRLWFAGVRDDLGDGFGIRDETGGAIRLAIDTSGNVGIGTSSPSYPLQVQNNGDTTFAITASTTTVSAINFGDTDAAHQGKIAYNNNGDYLYFSTNGYANERMRIDSSGKVGINTTGPFTPLHVSTEGAPDTSGDVTSGFVVSDGVGGPAVKISVHNTGALNYLQSGYVNNINVARNFAIFSGANEALRVDTSGNVGIGTSSPVEPLHVVDSASSGVTPRAGTIAFFEDDAAARITLGSANDNDCVIHFADADDNDVGGITYSHGGDRMEFKVNASERARITSGGNFLVGRGDTTVNSSNFGICLFADGRPKFSKDVNGGSHVMNVYGNAGEFRVYGDGDVQNTNNSYAGISDQSVKENIVDATDKLEDLKQVQIRNYNLIDDDLKQIGVIAQELEPIFPGLIKECDETGIKAVKYSVFVPILIKALQEADNKIDALEARITALES